VAAERVKLVRINGGLPADAALAYGEAADGAPVTGACL
jgi:hypothetical protein